MSIYTIRAQEFDGHWVGFVELGGRQVAMCTNGYLNDREALAAASKKREQMDADWEVIMRRSAPKEKT